MWKNHPDLHKRIISVLGEDIEGTQVITELKIYPDQVFAVVYERYDQPPLNLRKKNKDCIRFELFFQPSTASIEEEQSDYLPDKAIKFIDAKKIEFKMGRFSYKFGSEKITFHSFHALSYAKLVDNNFGKILD